jgi:hypothetical protein
MCATVQEIMNGNHLWNDGMIKGNSIPAISWRGHINPPATDHFIENEIFLTLLKQSVFSI